MKKILLILSIVFVAAAYAHSDYREGYRDGYHDASRHHRKVRFVSVVRSEPVYEEVVTYRRCRSHGVQPEVYHHHGALIGGLVGGIVGHHMDTRHKAHTTVGGAIAGAIIGSAIDDARRRHDNVRCRHIETQIVGYRNVGYWRGREVVEISERPLRRIRVPYRRR